MNKRSERFALSYHNTIQPTPSPTKKVEICKRFALVYIAIEQRKPLPTAYARYFSESFSNLDWLQLAII